MKLKLRIAAAVAVFVFAARSALAESPQGSLGSNRGTAHKPTTAGPRAAPKSKTEACGKYCRGQSKKLVADEKGTPFSQCYWDVCAARGSAGRPWPPRGAQARAEGGRLTVCRTLSADPTN